MQRAVAFVVHQHEWQYLKLASGVIKKVQPNETVAHVISDKLFPISYLPGDRAEWQLEHLVGTARDRRHLPII